MTLFLNEVIFFWQKQQIHVGCLIWLPQNLMQRQDSECQCSVLIPRDTRKTLAKESSTKVYFIKSVPTGVNVNTWESVTL